MIAQLIALAVLGPASVKPGTVELTVNVKDGDVISGEFQFKVTVKSDAPVNQVEFYIGDDLRDTDSSTPYEFKLDTIDANQPEGPLKVTFAAYTTEGDNAKKTLNLKVDNGLDKGPDFFVAKGLALVSNSKFDEAITMARIAMKAKPNYNPARLVMARAYLGKGVMDNAQKYAEDAVAADPSNVEGAELLSLVNLRRAYVILNRGGDKAETLKTIGTAMKSSVQTRLKTLESQIAKVDPPTAATLLRFADLCIQTGRYTSAINALAPAFRRDEKNTAIVNRLLYAQIRSARFSDATFTLDAYRKRGQMDAYGYALKAIMDLQAGDDASCDAAIKEAILDDNQNMGVQTAQAYIALRRGKLSVMDKLARDLAGQAGQLPVVNYYLGAAYNRLGRLDDARDRYEIAVLAEPMYFDVYVQQATDALTLVQSGRIDKKEVDFEYDVARQFYDIALTAKPESPEALTGMAIAYGLQGKLAECMNYARAATVAGPGYAAGYYALAAVLASNEGLLRNRAMKLERDGNREEAGKLNAQAVRTYQESMKAKETAGSLDKAYLQGIAIRPKLTDAYNYFARHGKLPLISPPSQ